MGFRKFQLIDIPWPDFGRPEKPPDPRADEYEKRIDDLRGRMRHAGLSHLIVYGDREHFANLCFLTGFDPRYEESILIISESGPPLILVGNECESYLSISPLRRTGALRSERFPSFSLLNQPRNASRTLAEILRAEGIAEGASPGCIGWKYFSEKEVSDCTHAIDLPAYIVDSLRQLAGKENVRNATALLMDPDRGLRTSCSVSEIAFFEYSNMLASEGMRGLFTALREGVTDFELVRAMQYNGTPLNCHVTIITGETLDFPLASPVGARIRKGDPFSANLGYWGSNICRAGWIAERAEDLPFAARSYVEEFAGPYFTAMAEWIEHIRIGTRGGEIHALIQSRLPYERFGVSLNPGHLSHLDEWVSSPMYEGSAVELRSGMYLQSDVIPFSKIYFSARIEDGYVLADAELRRQLSESFPECFDRCQKRRKFLWNVLGIEVPEELLPLSNIPALMPPFVLKPSRVCALK